MRPDGKWAESLLCTLNEMMGHEVFGTEDWCDVF